MNDRPTVAARTVQQLEELYRNVFPEMSPTQVQIEAKQALAHLKRLPKHEQTTLKLPRGRRPQLRRVPPHQVSDFLEDLLVQPTPELF